ncbi:MAG: hypothetical protein IJ438_01110 [Clostridia bacterium]|nr:hypothetical protein [Clostridia bacterium]MBQ8554447.1 hypothetical protein [Clostridia bacterium]
MLSLSVEEFWQTTPAALHDLLKAATQPSAPLVKKTKYADVAGW